MRIVVTGGRDYWNADVVERALAKVHAKHGIRCLIHGEASGADELAAAWAECNGVEVAGFPALWDDVDWPGAVIRTGRTGIPYDAAAGGRRNQQMIDEGRPDAAVAFPGGSGTADMVKRCEAAGLPIWKVRG